MRVKTLRGEPNPASTLELEKLIPFVQIAAPVAPPTSHRPELIEFFAGGGMARLGLGEGWNCTLSNDISKMKAATYRKNHVAGDFVCADISTLTALEIPGQPELAWGSFPCQDLSVAGKNAGLQGMRSGLFWQFTRLISELAAEGRAPRVIVLENVIGAITSHGGSDFAAICKELSSQGYRYGPMVIDTSLFLPQSRPRLFIVGIHKTVEIPPSIIAVQPSHPWTPPALTSAYTRLPADTAADWVWLDMPVPPQRKSDLVDLLDAEPTGVSWNSALDTVRILSMMSEANIQKIEEAKRAGRLVAGAAYRRTRLAADGTKVQRFEVRFDGVAGCLRTPGGGSSRQTLVVVHGDTVRTRLLSPRETANLMGLPATYVLPTSNTDAYHITGDGVAVPVVAWLARHILEPLVAAAVGSRAAGGELERAA